MIVPGRSGIHVQPQGVFVSLHKEAGGHHRKAILASLVHNVFQHRGIVGGCASASVLDRRLKGFGRDEDVHRVTELHPMGFVLAVVNQGVA